MCLIENGTESFITKYPADTIGITKNKYSRPRESGGRTTPTKWRCEIESAMRNIMRVTPCPRRIRHVTAGCAFPVGDGLRPGSWAHEIEHVVEFDGPGTQLCGGGSGGWKGGGPTHHRVGGLAD